MASEFQLVSSPEELGLSSRAITEFFSKHGKLGLHSLAVVKGGKAYALAVRPFAVDSPHTLFSLSKSFCSMAAGMAVHEGLLSYEDSVAEVLRDCLPEKYDKRLKEVTLHHLLSMSSGLEEQSDHEIRSSTDWARAALSYKVVHKPGTKFHYNTMGTYLAGRMVSARCGMSLRDYLMPRLFEPLGIKKPQWDCCPLGHNTGGFGLHLGVTDLARTAQLLLDGGVWQGKRLLSEDYLARATRKQVDNKDLNWDDPHVDWMSGYGYQFWMARHGRYRGDGMFGQVMMVDPNSKLAVCCTAGLNLMGDEMDAIHDLMDRLVSLPKEKAEGQAALKRLEKRLVFRAPADKGGPLFGEGNYFREDGKGLRVEIPDDNSLRLIFRSPDSQQPLFFSFGRKTAHRGEFPSFAMGERPQAYLGRFGVRDGVITARVVMPQAPYKTEIKLSPTPEGMRLVMDSVGFDSGTFLLKRAEQ